MRIHVGGDGSNLALVDTREYQSFVGADWCEDGLLYKHLRAQIGQAHALVWAVGFESDWKVDIEEGHSTERGFRAFTGDIVNTGNSLHLVNYDSLTMAAQSMTSCCLTKRRPTTKSRLRRVRIASGSCRCSTRHRRGGMCLARTRRLSGLSTRPSMRLRCARLQTPARSGGTSRNFRLAMLAS